MPHSASGSLCGPASTPRGHFRRGRRMTVTFSRRALCPSLMLGSGIAAAYWAIGKLALFFAVPPGYATAVWPPAGIAFAVVVVYGAWVWPGIVLGSVLVNLGYVRDTCLCRCG